MTKWWLLGRFLIITRNPTTHRWSSTSPWSVYPDEPWALSTFGTVFGIKGNLAIVGGVTKGLTNDATVGVYVYLKQEGTWSFVQKLTPMCNPTCQGSPAFMAMDVVDESTFCISVEPRLDCYQLNSSTGASSPFSRAYSMPVPSDLDGILAFHVSSDRRQVLVAYVTKSANYAILSLGIYRSLNHPDSMLIRSSERDFLPSIPPTLVSLPTESPQIPTIFPTDLDQPQATPIADYNSLGNLSNHYGLLLAVTIVLVVLTLVGIAMLVSIGIKRYYRRRKASRSTREPTPLGLGSAPTLPVRLIDPPTEDSMTTEPITDSDELYSSDENESEPVTVT